MRFADTKLPFGRFKVTYHVCEVVFRNCKINYLLLWGYPIDGLKFAKLHLVDVKLPTAVKKLPTAVANLDFLSRTKVASSCFKVASSGVKVTY